MITKLLGTRKRRTESQKGPAVGPNDFVGDEETTLLGLVIRNTKGLESGEDEGLESIDVNRCLTASRVS